MFGLVTSFVNFGLVKSFVKLLAEAVGIFYYKVKKEYNLANAKAYEQAKDVVYELEDKVAQSQKLVNQHRANDQQREVFAEQLEVYSRRLQERRKAADFYEYQFEASIAEARAEAEEKSQSAAILARIFNTGKKEDEEDETEGDVRRVGGNDPGVG